MKIHIPSTAKKYLLTGLISIFLVALIIFTGLQVWVKHEANVVANDAAFTFQKDKTEALLALISSDQYSLQEKNNAIWALGVLKDEKALPLLESLYTGKECDHDNEYDGPRD